MNNDEKKTNRSKILSFLVNGAKKTMSPNVTNTNTAKYIKRRSVDMCNETLDILSIFWLSFGIIFYYILGIFKMAKNVPHAFRRAAQNNFRLGVEALASNNLIDARIRFLLSNLFYNKSATTKYYIAYIYYIQHNFSKSLKYLKQAISLQPNHKRSRELLKIIEIELKNK